MLRVSNLGFGVWDFGSKGFGRRRSRVQGSGFGFLKGPHTHLPLNSEHTKAIQT